MSGTTTQIRMSQQSSHSMVSIGDMFSINAAVATALVTAGGAG